MVVFAIDNPPGENNARYRVGWNIDDQGAVRNGWSPWVGIDGWGSWEDAGGGIALAMFVAGRRPRAVVLHVDNPPQRNNGLNAVVELVLDIDQAQTLGGWRLLPWPSWPCCFPTGAS
ncbi:MAG: hypothetical protein QOG20_4491 [Pseudonocardiales bacterium]|nr:hypothetical protein [Pseudonocardiales bacterium]